MLTNDEILRYDRQLKTKAIGLEGQLRLKQAKVLLIGAGGLGCPALQYMAAAGIGKIHILDGDIVNESNLQRQLLFTTNDVGKYKAEVAAGKLQLINPFIDITFQNQFLSATLALSLFPLYNLIVDCSDNFGTRYLINDVCLLNNLAFVSASLYQTEAQLGTFNMILGNNTRSASYSDIFPESDKNAQSLNCNAAGVIATLPGIMGVMQANEVLKYYTDKTNCLTNQLLLLNAINLKTSFFKFEASNSTTKVSEKFILNKTYDIPCSTSNKLVIDASELQQIPKNIYTIIDVREKNELPIISSHKIINIPLSVLNERMDELKKYNSIIFVCKSGVRSKKAAQLAKEKLIDLQIYSYKNGIEELIKLI
ncbi:MAG: HesA/MoeB/ThiF family protein [Bacteroidia bacterium]|nr:HesA/MoeB/ThiF family protein [Bacteroidia bacterium]